MNNAHELFAGFLLGIVFSITIGATIGIYIRTKTAEQNAVIKSQKKQREFDKNYQHALERTLEHEQDYPIDFANWCMRKKAGAYVWQDDRTKPPITPQDFSEFLKQKISP